MSLGFTTWNIEHGFVDAMLRGWRSTFLTDLEYSNLKEGGRRAGADSKTKEDFEDMRLTLQETDYGNFLQAEVGAAGLAQAQARARVRVLGMARGGHGWRSARAHSSPPPTACAACSRNWTPRSSAPARPPSG